MSQDNRLMPLSPGAAPLDRPLRELTHPDRPNNTYANVEPTHLRDYLMIVLKRKWLILSLAVVVTSLVAIQMYRQPSIYEAQTTIQLEQKSKSLIKTKELVLNAGTDPTFWPTQLKLLENPRLARKVILALGLHSNPAFTGGQERPGLLGALRRVVSSQQPKQNDKASEGGLSVVNDAAPVEVAADAGKLAPEQQARMEGMEDVFRSRLEISPVLGTNLIDIRFQHSDPALAMKITDTVAAVFINENLDRETQGAKQATEQLAQRIIDLQLQLRTEQEQELRFKQANGLALGATQGENLAVLQLTTYSSQMMDAEAKYKGLQSDWERAREALRQPGGINSIPAVQGDKYIQEMQTKLQDLEQQRAALLVNYTEKNPAVIKIDEQRRNLERSMARRAQDAVTSLENQYEAARSNAEKMRRNYEQARVKVNSQGIAATRLANLQANLETTKQMYNTSLQKQKEVELSPAETASNITIATVARTPALIGPPRVRNILIALLLSLGAGIGLAFLLDYLDDTLKSIEDVDRHIHLPTLALIPAPRVERKKLMGSGVPAAPAEALTALALTEDVRSPVTEAYRHLRTSLLLSSAGQPPRTILVTSSQPSEGKTTTAVNTALMLAQTGAEVLLLDCDLRRPRIHGHFQLPNARGVTNYLSGEMGVEPLLQTYEKQPNLKVMTSGPVPPNAAELLGSEQMRRLLAAVADRFQHVIIDSPPAISFTDASILSTMTDGVMLVVHGGRSSRAVVRRAKQQLLDVGAHIFGIVLNNVKPDSTNSYYYYYASYYSGYYAADEENEGDGAELAGDGTTTKRA